MSNDSSEGAVETVLITVSRSDGEKYLTVSESASSLSETAREAAEEYVREELEPIVDLSITRSGTAVGQVSVSTEGEVEGFELGDEFLKHVDTRPITVSRNGSGPWLSARLPEDASPELTATVRETIEEKIAPSVESRIAANGEVVGSITLDTTEEWVVTWEIQETYRDGGDER